MPDRRGRAGRAVSRPVRHKGSFSLGRNEEEGEEKNNREQGSRMDWHEATSASGERPAVHPDCRRPIKISYGSDLTFPETQLTRARLEVGVIVDGSASHNWEM
ncbi:hypothetical protein DBV15_00056, partial [Temnothorax longispinosus]